jgi:lipid-A-disaccharide synthase
MNSEEHEILRLMIVAGEASGDAHAAALVRALGENAPGKRFEIFGATGREMRAAGVESIVNTDELSIVGLLEIARALPRFHQAYKKLKKAALERRPHAVILVDWPDFNLRLARALHRQGLKIIYYISPQLWAWRAWRARSIRRDVDLLLTILPFEPQWYQGRGINHVEFIGHPLAGTVVPRFDRQEFCRRNELDTAKPIIAFLPGSRRQELARILPVMLDAAQHLTNRVFNEVQFVIALAHNRSRSEVDSVNAAFHLRNSSFDLSRVRVVQDETREALAAADAAGIASGTATLEAALVATPHVVVYKESLLNWHTLGRMITTEHYGLSNLIAGERIAPELMQNDFTGQSLARELEKLLNPDHNHRMREKLRAATDKLDADKEPASNRAARTILRAIDGWKDDKR